MEDRAEARATVRRLLAALPRREREVMKLRFGLLDGEPELLVHEIGARLGVSSRSARRLVARALRLLTESFGAAPLTATA